MHPFLLTFQLASVTTLLLLPTGLAIAYWLTYGRSRWRPVVEVVVTLPLVLPPTVLGFYLLLAFSPESWFGGWLLRTFDVRLLFSFPGLVIGSWLYSLPFMVQPLRSGFEQLPRSLREAAWVLGKSPWQTFRKVLLPNLRPALLTACVLTFAHTVGEFGVVLMIGGNIPGVSRVASIAIYDEVESLNYSLAHQYSLILLLLSVAVLLVVYLINGRQKIVR
ncbi:molybdate ABC transporter permease subunit [Lewinellaceae bacterium SD302]|nr:molybdate ABC transporter permease subunit [Lewinellaceae bacterium SD302]